jgi:hypothetical protein
MVKKREHIHITLTIGIILGFLYGLLLLGPMMENRVIGMSIGIAIGAGLGLSIGAAIDEHFASKRHHSVGWILIVLGMIIIVILVLVSSLSIVPQISEGEAVVITEGFLEQIPESKLLYMAKQGKWWEAQVQIGYETAVLIIDTRDGEIVGLDCPYGYTSIEEFYAYGGDGTGCWKEVPAQLITIEGAFKKVEGVMDPFSCYCSRGGYIDGLPVCFDDVEGGIDCEYISASGYYVEDVHIPARSDPCQKGRMSYLKAVAFSCR